MDPASAAAVTAREVPILVHVHWQLGLHGEPQHRALWVGGIDEPAGASWDRFDLDGDEGPAVQQWLESCEDCRDHGYELCDDAFDAVRSASGGALPSGDFPVELARKEHLILPSPDLARVVILYWRDFRRGIIELPLLRETPWPADTTRGKGPRPTEDRVASWSGDGTRLAIVRDSTAYAGPGVIAEQHPHVLVVDARSGAILHDIAVDRGVQDVGWSPDGARLALLVSDLFEGDNLVERFYAKLGHGRPYENLYVQVVDLATGAVIESELGRDMPEVTAHLVWDPNVVAPRELWKIP